jgi:hypothetical protein
MADNKKHTALLTNEAKPERDYGEEAKRIHDSFKHRLSMEIQKLKQHEELDKLELILSGSIKEIDDIIISIINEEISKKSTL